MFRLLPGILDIVPLRMRDVDWGLGGDGALEALA
jgi:hypothetical protein